SLDIPASLPADAIVDDVDLHLRMDGDVFEKNIRIELESPSGTTVVLWNQATGCSGPLWVCFDDEGNGGGACVQFTTNQRARIPFGSDALQTFEGQPVNGIWKLRIRDLNGFGDVATVSEVRLAVRYKAAFSAGFPNDLQFPGQLTQITPTSFVVPAPLLDGCSDVTLSFSDETTSQPCSTGLTAIILRTWTARDASNNLATCVQTIRLLRPGLDDVVLPPNYNETDAPAFECGSPYPTPAWITSQGKQGTPYVFGQSAGCSVNWSYTDVVVGVCAGSYTINRSWLIVDACSAQSKQATQMIKVLDRQGPVISCPANLTVTTDLYNCCATVNLPDALVDDACSPAANLNAKVVVFNQYSGDTMQVMNVNGMLSNFPGNNPADPDTLAAFGNTACLPVGTHHVYYRVEDVCGNLKTCSYQLAVRDYTPPVALGHSLTIVSLGADDVQDCYEPGAGGAHFAGVTFVAASALDQGSYDNCNFIRVTVRRLPPYSACIAALNNINGGSPCQDNFPDLKSEYARATGESDSIKFYCCEAGTTQTLALRCYQLDGLGNYSMGPTGLPIFNETLIQVEVQDKLSPGCQSPPDLTVSCETFDPTLINYGLPALIDNCCLDTTKTYHNQPGLNHTVDYSLFDSLCDRGTLVRTFKVYDCQGQTSSCTQKITVTQHLDYAIAFPDDVEVTFCDSSGIYGKPVLHGQACELLAVSFSDEVYTVVTDGCYEIERTWRVKDLCNSFPGGGCIEVPNPTPFANLNAPQNLLGPVVAPPGTPAPWNATVSKITPSDAQATDYSSFWNPNVNCYEYKQIIKVIDKQEPVVENVSDTVVVMKDQTLNVDDLWNETYWLDNSTGSHNLGEGPSGLSITASDLCSGSNIAVRFLLFLDLDGDNVMETVVNSADLPGFNNVQFGNALNPNYTGGVSRAFDERVVPPDQKYGFMLQTADVGNKKTATVCWNTQAQPDNFVTPELPYGRHKIKWIVSDGCGNESVREYAFEVIDSKAPTVVCFNGLSVNIMSTDMIQLWATDFLQYALDNHTPPTTVTPTPNLLRYAIRKVGTGVGFPVDGQGLPLTNVVFTCAELGPQQVELWAMDLAGNAGYCVATIDVQDNDGFCATVNDPNFVTVAGALKTEPGDGLENAGVDLQALLPNGGTPLSLNDITDD
ncbi:MAG TPA: proprotein convertase P-domain-containing protein, partial [Saprospiraceae bacterium]|nr:proprotein convertase P-domain-containing protein [Saprospiraceae bacterium]